MKDFKKLGLITLFSLIVSVAFFYTALPTIETKVELGKQVKILYEERTSLEQDVYELRIIWSNLQGDIFLREEELKNLSNKYVQK